jgi:hypothetical protein
MKSSIGPIAIMALALVFPILMAGPSDGAVIVLEGSSVEYSPSEPTHSQVLNVSATVLFIDAEPGSVILKWSLCTEEQCGLDTPVEMTRVGETNEWKATIGPFAEKDPTGKPYIDIRIHVVATGTATDGSEDPTEASPVETIYFKESDIPDGNEEDDGKDSPIGAEIAIGGILIAAALVAFRLRKGRLH